MRIKIQHIQAHIPNHLIYIGIMAALFIILFLKLSLWQFTRSKEKSLILSKINQISQNSRPILITSSDQINQQAEYNYVTINGYWDQVQTIYLSNKFHNHKPGYHVITPFIIENPNTSIKQAILVNRGWISDIKPLLNTPNNLQPSIIKIDGVIKNSNKNQYIMGENLASYGNYHIIQRLDLLSLKPLYNYVIAEKYLNLIAPKNQGYIMNWQWTNISPNKHLAYAIQWLLLAITTILLYSYLCYNTLTTRYHKKC